ncbi:hypothetical protein BKI52_42540 [marine bacterium AO1-C]|nr:hypothetical protein BKI52_42540 [marine bacterium AO1-C]
MNHLPIYLLALGLLMGCAQSQQTTTEEVPKLQYAFSKKIKSINTQLKGYWKSIGHGYILDASADSIRLYSYTKSFCYREKNDYLERLMNSQTQFHQKNDTLSIFLMDFGPQTTHLQSRRDFVRIQKLPENHLSFDELQQLPPLKLFDLFIETLEENYAFSKERKLEWAKIRKDLSEKISDSTTHEALFQMMGKITKSTKDHHTKIIAKDGRKLQYTRTPSAQYVIDLFRKQTAVSQLNKYFGLYFDNNYKNISDSLLKGKGQKVANQKIEWGSLSEQIGYIHIHSLTGFADSKLPRKQHIDTLNYHMAQIIKALQDKEALIIDISFNFGGYDAAGLTIASYFTDTSRLAYQIQVFQQGQFYDESPLYVRPAKGARFTKPVYLLMTDISRSAAETFAMQMKAIPQVKLVGMPTLGILSDMLGKSIGPFYTTSSNRRYVAPDGKVYEVSGVIPDIPLQVFAANNTFNSHKNAVSQLANMVERNEVALKGF